MLPLRTLLLAGLAALGAAGCGACAGSRAQAEGEDGGGLTRALGRIIASCAEVQGQVEALRAAQPFWEAVATGAVFRSGDWVRTGPLSFARIEFLRGGRLELGEKAVVLVEVPSEGDGGDALAAPHVAVKAGSVRAVLTRTEGEAQPGALVVRTEEGQAVRLVPAEGSDAVEVRLTRTESGGTAVALAEGHALLVTEGGAQPLEPGQAVEVVRGALGEVVQLLDFPVSVEPGVDARVGVAEGREVRLLWRRLERAAAYRVEVARDLSFTQLVASEEVAANSFAFRPPGEGTYAWRVAARDGRGYWGEFGFARRIFVEREQPRDLLVAPAGDALVPLEPAGVTFTWQSVGGAVEYRLVVADNPQLRAPRVVRTTQGQQLGVTDLPAGRWYWGVYVLGTPERPLFTQPRALLLRKPPRGKARLNAPQRIENWGL